jgi:hypothetical protein
VREVARSHISPLEYETWFTTHYPECLPLVKAMARVIGAEGQFGQSNRTDMLDLADLQTIQSVISTSLQIHRQHQSMSKALGKGINRKIQLLISHQRAGRTTVAFSM